MFKDKIDKNVFNAEILKIPLVLKAELKPYCEKLLVILNEKLISVNVVGSAVTADFYADYSDVNLLFVFSELGLKDLEAVAPMVNKWWKKHRFSPRFISKANLITSLNYFPIDFWVMQHKHYVLFGEDILNGLVIEKKDLLWQLIHEVKGLRMRIKQQFWRTSKEAYFAKKNILADFNTLYCLLKVIFYLNGLPIPEASSQFINQVRQELEIESGFLESAISLKQGKIKLGKQNIFVFFDGLLNSIRRLDEIAGEIKI